MDIKELLTKKVGPLPAWAWVVGGGALAYLLFRRSSTPAASSYLVGPSAQGGAPISGGGSQGGGGLNGLNGVTNPIPSIPSPVPITINPVGQTPPAAPYAPVGPSAPYDPFAMSQIPIDPSFWARNAPPAVSIQPPMQPINNPIQQPYQQQQISFTPQGGPNLPFGLPSYYQGSNGLNYAPVQQPGQFGFGPPNLNLYQGPPSVPFGQQQGPAMFNKVGVTGRYVGDPNNGGAVWMPY